MEPNRVEFQKQCIFQSFCKRVLHNEACNAHEEIRRRRAKESGDSEVWDGMDEGTLSKTKEMLDDMHKRKIDLADGIYVINVGGYIGDSTRSEIAYAKAHGKKVEYLEK